MAKIFDYELVGKIGSMALIRKKDNDIDYNIFYVVNVYRVSIDTFI